MNPSLTHILLQFSCYKVDMEVLGSCLLMNVGEINQSAFRNCTVVQQQLETCSDLPNTRHKGHKETTALKVFILSKSQLKHAEI